ncbi:MAG: N-formylglutamate amidohydrolase [Bdellovibrionales bacterium]|nr:N-formylglutamate amidohydrolase [Bdellovibrionales bacterium]
MNKKPLLVSIPHSGEKIVDECAWLKDLDEVTLMYDVDRFVDQMYESVLSKYNIPKVVTEYHRYVVDCNRWPTDVDCDSVEGSEKPSGSHPTGLHWRKTTAGYILLKKPLSQNLHKDIIKKYYTDFFKAIDSIYESFHQRRENNIYHLDLHSMPSHGTTAHRDPGEDRVDIVIGNEKGRTATAEWTEQVSAAYRHQGFHVRLNHPYTGGTIVEKYGCPQEGRQALMIELNRKLYMDEKTKKIIPDKAKAVKERLNKAISEVYHHLPLAVE